MSFFEPLSSFYALILISKFKLNVLYRAVYLSRLIKPNKHPKIKCQIWSKVRLPPFLSFLLLRGKFKCRIMVTQNAPAYTFWPLEIAPLCCLIAICDLILMRLSTVYTLSWWGTVSLQNYNAIVLFCNICFALSNVQFAML